MGGVSGRARIQTSWVNPRCRAGHYVFRRVVDGFCFDHDVRDAIREYLQV
jgi:hypothetical protein